LFLLNPHAGKSAIKNQLLPIVDCFAHCGYRVDLHASQAPGELTRLAREAAPDYDLVVCSGGDGTLCEVVNGLMAAPRRPVLGYIPAGTTNDFAASFQLPKNMVACARTVMDGVATPFDVGRFGSRYFAYVAAFGTFTEVTWQTPQETKSVLGRMAYFLEGAARLPALKTYRVRVEYDGGVIEDDILLGVVTNSAVVAGMPLSRVVDSSMDDGLMEVFLVRNPASVLELAPVAGAFLQGEIDGRYIHFLRTSRLRIFSESDIAWTLDGEFGGVWREADIENLPRALTLMTPRA
jgi:YegS/Rv2252/BmrU family lipid kinase